MANKPSVDELLLMATALHGSQSATCNRILKQTLMWVGQWDARSRQALYGDQHHLEVDRLYQRLIGLSKCPAETALIIGYGNLGTEFIEPSWPNYVGFNVTATGLKVAEELRLRFSSFTSFELDDHPRDTPL